MTISNQVRDMRYTPSFFKQGLVLSTAVAVMVAAIPAQAYSPRNQQPSIEIHLEVLESLRQDALRQQQAVPVAPTQRVPQTIPFGRPSAPLGAQAPLSAPAAPATEKQQGYATYQPSDTPKPAPKPTAPVKKAESQKAQASKPVSAKKAEAKPAAEKSRLEKTAEKPAAPMALKPEKNTAIVPAAPMMKLPAPRELESLPPLEGESLAPASEEKRPTPSKVEESKPALSILDETPPLSEKAQPDIMPELPTMPAAEEEMDTLPPLPPMDEPEMPSLPEFDAMPDDAVEDEVSALPALPREAELPESPALSDAPAPEVEADDGGLLVVPAPLPATSSTVPAAKKDGGMFSGLKKQISSMLGGDDDTPAPSMDTSAPELPSLPEGAAPAMEDDAPALPDLPDMPESANAASDTVEAALPALPPLPREEVEEVPVSTTPNRSLPSLGAIVSEERRAAMQEMEAPALPDVKAVAHNTVEQALAELPQPPALPDDSAMMSLDSLPELPPLEDTPSAVPSMAEDTLELASLPPLPEPPAAKARGADAPATAGTTPEVKEQGKFVRLLYGREDEEIQPAMLSALDGLAQKMKAEPTLKLSMESFAGSDKEQESLAKRISLKRALGVRSYLIDAGIEADRILPPKVLGSNVQNGPLERIDIRLQ